MASSEGFAVTSYATPPAFAPAIELDDGHVVVRLARNALATRDAKRVDANSRVALRLRVAPGPGERGGGDDDDDAASSKATTHVVHVDGALVEGVETALLRGGEDGAGMTAGDVFLVSCTMDRTLTDDAPFVAPGAIDITKRRYDETHFEVDVLAVEDAWPGKISGTAKQKLERGEALKRLGNKLLKEGRARRAEVKYAAGVEMFTVMGAEFVHSNVPTAEETKTNRDAEAMGAALYNNLAVCLMKRDAFHDAEIACTEALDLSPGNIKALLRRGTCRIDTLKWDEAEVDFFAALKHAAAANDTKAFFALEHDLHKQRMRLKSMRKAQDAKDLEVVSGMFDRLSGKAHQRAHDAVARRRIQKKRDKSATWYDAADVALPGEAFPMTGTRAQSAIKIDDIDAEIAAEEEEEADEARADKSEMYNTLLRTGAMRMYNPDNF